MKFLVTGGCGFLGSNVGKQILDQGDQLIIVDNFFRTGSQQNLAWLRDQGTFEFHQCDLRDRAAIDRIVKEGNPDVVFHFAGQVAMTTSIADPRLDFEINVGGGLNILEAVRHFAPEAIVFYSSTNKVYGDLEDIELEETKTRYKAPRFPNGFDETLRLDFRSPYGCSKGSMDQYMLDYARIFGLKTVVFRHSSIFGGRQFSTFDQGWVGWFVARAVARATGKETEPFTIAGNGKQVRDVLFASDIVGCYFAALNSINSIKGEVFNIGGGMENSLSLLELFSDLQELLDVELVFTQTPARQSDQKVFVADNTKVTGATGWAPAVKSRDGLQQMIEWVREA